MLDSNTIKTRRLQPLNKLLVFLVLVSLSCWSHADFPIRDIRIIDGDTIEASIDLPWDITIRKQSIRFLEFDAWEISRRRQGVDITDAELIKGQKAADDLKEILDTAYEITIRGSERDSFGRILAYVYVEATETSKPILVNKLMTRRGHSRD